MTARMCHVPSLGIAAAFLLGFVAAGCEQASSPRQVQASNPTVTYKYMNDRDLIEANQQAAAFCSQYRSVPRTASLTTDRDGGRVAVFECVQGGSTASMVSPASPSLTYTYRTDRELLEATRTAQSYCANRGSPQVVSDVIANANGSRTVMFRCSPG